MRIVVDMQGAQLERHANGRHTLALAAAVVRNKGEHEILLVLNGMLADSVAPIREVFYGLLPREHIRLWFAPGLSCGRDSDTRPQRIIAEHIREAFLASLHPDIVLIPSLFESCADSALYSIEKFDTILPVAMIFHASAPYIYPAEPESRYISIGSNSHSLFITNMSYIECKLDNVDNDQEYKYDLASKKIITALENIISNTVQNTQALSVHDDTLYGIMRFLSMLEKSNHGSWVLEKMREYAWCLAATFPHTGKKRRLLVDISDIVRFDCKTGIQRVTRSLLMYMLKHPPYEYIVTPIYISNGGYRYKHATKYIKSILGAPITAYDTDDDIDYAPGDIYFGLDLNLKDMNIYQQQIIMMHNLGVKIIFLVHDILCIMSPHFFDAQHTALFKKWLDFLPNSDGVICVSRSTANEFTQWMRENAPQRLPYVTINWSHNGASVEQSCPSRGMPNNAASLLRKLSCHRAFLMVGTLEPRKGHLQTIAAFERLWGQDHDICLVIVGKQGWQIETLIHKLKRHPERDRRLIWLEGVSDEYLEKLYAACSCLIAASEGEGFGLPLVEAAQRKLPIIARDIPVFREIAGEHAWYFLGNHAEDLAQAITAWLVLYERGEHPKSDAMPWLSWEQSAKNTLGILLSDTAQKAENKE